MNKSIKVLLSVLVALVLAVVLMLAAHPLWVGSLVKAVAEKVGPKYTGTPITLSSCGVNLYSGHFELLGFKLSNPQGCVEDTAAGVGNLKVDFDTLSALSDIINVRSVELSGLFASYVKGASGKYNFTEIADNAKAATGGADAKKVEQSKSEQPKTEEKTSGKKLVIEHLSVGNVKVSAFGMKMTLLPGTITLKDIGKKSNGVTAKEAFTQMWEQVLASSGAAGKQFAAAWELSAGYGKKGLDYGKQGLDVSTDAAKKALDSVKKLDTKGATDAIKNAGDSLKNVGNGLKGLLGK